MCTENFFIKNQAKMKKMLCLSIILYFGIVNTINLYAQTQIGMDFLGTNPTDNFGTSLSLSSDGQILAIGVSGHDTRKGQVEVYQNQSGNWIPLGEPIKGDQFNSYFGFSIASSSDGRTVAIGATGYNSRTGQVRVYENQTDSWIQIGTPIDGTTLGDRLGNSVSMSADGKTLAVGAVSSNNRTGQVKVYENQTGSWIQIGTSIDGLNEDDLFGYEVSLSSDGKTLAISIRGYNNSTGQVQVYENQSGTWTPVGNPINGKAADDTFGHDISLSSNGQILAIGARGYNSSTGQVEVYENQSNNWVPFGTPIDGTTFGDNFGAAISLSADGKTLAISAFRHNDLKGQVKIYKKLRWQNPCG